MKKTKEEILKAHLRFKNCISEDGSVFHDITEAMQEYADLRIEEELEDLVESMKETRCEYHLAITEGRLGEYKNKCK